MKTYKLNIYGQVQGVFFRVSTQEIAQSLQITGWVQNNTNGTVEILASGEDAALTQFINWCYNGPPMAQVKSIQKMPQTPRPYKNFEIR